VIYGALTAFATCLLRRYQHDDHHNPVPPLKNPDDRKLKQMRVLSKKTAAIATTAVILVAGTGVAYAFWSAGGSGSGTAASGTTTPLTVNQVTVVTDLHPGDSPQTLSGTFDNTSAGTVHVTSVIATIDSVTGGTTNGAGCSAADYTLANPTMSAVQEVAVGSSVGHWTGASIQFNNTTANQDDCKGAVVHLHYAVV
jgi:hypothetical protein